MRRLERAWRGPGPGRPEGLALPPDRLPPAHARRLLKRWRWVGAFGPELMLCAGLARIGPTLQSWWAVWDRDARCLREHTRRGHGGLRFARGRVTVDDGPVEIDLELAEEPGVEVVTPDGPGYAWTRKQGGIAVRGSVRLDGRTHPLEAAGFVDDSAGYHARRTAWRWSAGVGTAHDGRDVAWNLVEGIHDSPAASERTVWVAGEPREVAPARFDDLDAIRLDSGEELRFAGEATRERHDNLVLFRSDYVQPFGTFAGALPGAGELREGYGVMERHEVLW